MRVPAIFCLTLVLCALCTACAGNDQRDVSRPHVAKDAPRGVIDVPHADAEVQPRFIVAGWVLDSHGVRAVRIYVDDVLVARIVPAVPRPDVLAVSPALADANPMPGWMVEVDAKSFRGSRIVRAESIDRKGGRAQFASVSVSIRDYGIGTK